MKAYSAIKTTYALGLGQYSQHPIRYVFDTDCRYDTYLIQYTCAQLKVSKSRILDFNNKVNVWG